MSNLIHRAEYDGKPLIIDLAEGVNLVGVLKITLDVAMTLPEADGTDEPCRPSLMAVRLRMVVVIVVVVIMVVVIMIIVVILKEMMRHILGGRFLAFTNATGPCFRRELISIEGPRLEERENILVEGEYIMLLWVTLLLHSL